MFLPALAHLIILLVICTSLHLVFLPMLEQECSSVYSFLGSLNGVTYVLGVLPIWNKVTGSLICKDKNSQPAGLARMVLPMRFCPDNAFFNRVDVAREMIDRLCTPEGSGSVYRASQILDTDSEPAFVSQDMIPLSVHLGQDVDLSKGVTIEANLNRGPNYVTERDYNMPVWVPIQIQNIPRGVIVFLKSAVLVAISHLKLNDEFMAAEVWRILMNKRSTRKNRFVGEWHIREVISDDQDIPIRILVVSRIQKGEECPICLEAPKDISPIIPETCGHSFHERCLQSWIDSTSSNASRCPICRQSLRN